jgi:hypothetical protein
MTDTSEKVQLSSSALNEEFAIAQMEQAIESFRDSAHLTAQISTVMVTADALLVGYALTTQIAGIIFVGAIFPMTIIIFYRLMLRVILPLWYVTIGIEEKLGGQDVDWLITTFLSHTTSKEYIGKLKSIATIPNHDARMRALHEMATPPMKTGERGLIQALLIVIAFGQIAVPFALWQFFGWRLF